MIDIHKYSYDEVNIISKETTYFIKEHLTIYTNILEKIICKLEISDELILRHKTLKACNFDTYLKKYLKEEKKNHEVKKLVDLHDTFHKLILFILEKTKDNKKITSKEFQKLSSVHMKFIHLLNEISLSLEFVKYQFDKLTYTWSREIFLDLLNKEFLKASRTKEVFSLVFFDIDYFKKVNDTYGHDAGDYILKELTKLVKDELRVYDTIGRWGGEEFLILLSQSNIKEAYEIIKRIKDKIQNNIFIYESNNISLTCSFGICEFNKNLTISQMISKSDKLMYIAKNNGRNKIEV